MGNCLKKNNDDGQVMLDVNGNGLRMSEVLFFPDEKLPCKFHPGCRRGDNCDYAHCETSLTRMLKVINAATISLDVCVFTITCDSISETIISAHKRGVRVRVLTDGAQQGTLGSDIQTFRDNGIPVKTNHGDFHMHHKFAVVDSKVLLTGSFNWTMQASIKNNENLVITKDQYLINSYNQEFNKLWAKYT